ncbi:MAG: hypothetical protein IKI50_05860 [Clostridia bacterium]|nr:hypothetical protein [Clostridia bacterium]
MAQILETVMLICFGFSWPINAYKNFKAGTARTISLPFNLLIIAGYLAGIAAKFCTGTVNYVTAVYFLNLAMVSLNVAVYFRNRRLDKARAAKDASR